MWINLNNEDRLIVLNQVAIQKKLPTFVIEKDWWVCTLLRAIFQSKYKEFIIFKGGTSLSKAYHIIDRFSEDIDLIIDRHLLGFEELKSGTQIKKLRKASGGFIINEFRNELIHQLDLLGISRELYEIKFNEKVDDTSDPNTLEIYYQSIVPSTNEYIQQRVLLEMGARSLIEPAEMRNIDSYIDLQFANSRFSQNTFEANVVVPTRTFIEKVLLLHEEFSKPIDKIRTERLTRHYYDLDRLLDTNYGPSAIKDDELFQTIVDHRKAVNVIRGMNYSNHIKGNLNILPPNEIISTWEHDYKTMQNFMIVGESLPWEILIQRITKIQNLINNK